MEAMLSQCCSLKTIEKLFYVELQLILLSISNFTVIEKEYKILCLFSNNTNFPLDSFFTERYVTNTKESAGLEDDVASKALDLQARNYFLIQGTGDELVHEQHAFSLVKSMVDKEVIFRQQVGSGESIVNM
jgi:hypothetical protein